MNSKFIATIGSLVILMLFSNSLLKSQCTDDTHSINSSDSWLSCQGSEGPNAIRGNSHWILYDLGYNYILGATTIWNYNVENATGNGFKNVVVDYSLDGVTWIQAGQFLLPEANGSSNYTGFDGFDLGDVEARYVLFTAIDNWNGGDCMGISEVRIEVRIPNTDCADYIVDRKIEDLDIDEGVYYADNTIVAEGTVKNGSIVEFKSAESIQLTPNFTAEIGSEFLAKIENCQVTQPLEKNPTNVQYNLIEPEESPLAFIDIKLYPNPTNDILNVSANENIKEIIIIDALGRKLIQKSIQQATLQLDVSDFLAGIYHVHIIADKKQVITKPFIKG